MEIKHRVREEHAFYAEFCYEYGQLLYKMEINDTAVEYLLKSLEIIKEKKEEYAKISDICRKIVDFRMEKAQST